MRAYYVIAGAHVHAAFFHNGKMGDLVCRVDEFPSLQAAMSGIDWISKEEEQEMSGFSGICKGGPYDGQPLQFYKQSYPVIITGKTDGRYEFSLRGQIWNWVGPDVPAGDEPPPRAA